MVSISACHAEDPGSIPGRGTSMKGGTEGGGRGRDGEEKGGERRGAARKPVGLVISIGKTKGSEKQRDT